MRNEPPKHNIQHAGYDYIRIALGVIAGLATSVAFYEYRAVTIILEKVKITQELTERGLKKAKEGKVQYDNLFDKHNKLLDEYEKLLDKYKDLKKQLELSVHNPQLLVDSSKIVNHAEEPEQNTGTEEAHQLQEGNNSTISWQAYEGNIIIGQHDNWGN